MNFWHRYTHDTDGTETAGTKAPAETVTKIATTA